MAATEATAETAAAMEAELRAAMAGVAAVEAASVVMAGPAVLAAKAADRRYKRAPRTGRQQPHTFQGTCRRPETSCSRHPWRTWRLGKTSCWGSRSSCLYPAE